LPYVLVDTSVFIRLEGAYKRTFDCIVATCDVIAYTNEILGEYRGRAHSSPLFHLQPFLRELGNKSKLKYFKSSFVASRLRRHENIRKINYPTHSRDRKWIKAAIAIRAKYLLTTNRHLLEVPTNRYNDNIVDIIEPSKYVETRCG